jgi:hypothetical protein
MKVCNVKIEHTMRNVGVFMVERCQNPVVEGENLCLKHLKKKQKRMVKWGDRKDYSPITYEEMKNGKSFKLADTHAHRLFRLRNDIIQYFTKNNGWVDTEMPITPELYCRKIN